MDKQETARDRRMEEDMRKIRTIFWKQIKDTIKNKAVFIQFVLFPVMVVIMENAVKVENMPEHFFVLMFSAMYIGMAPLTCISAIISEEKETGTLGMLRISNVKAWEYLAGIGAYVFALCMAGSLVFAWAGEYRGWRMGAFLMVLAAGILISMLTGAVIGLVSRNQMSATSLTVPVTMVFAFLPMLSLFNEKIREIARFVYSCQIQEALGRIREAEEMKEITGGNWLGIVAVNLLIAAAAFGAVYKKGVD